MTNKLFLSLSSEVHQETRHFLDSLNLNYFQYLTVYDDGGYSILCNQGEYIEASLNYAKQNNYQAIFSYINQKEILSKNSYYFLWDFNLPPTPVNFAREWNFNHGLTFVERYADYYNLIAIAAPHSHLNPLDTYFNNINQLQAFIQNFKEDKKDLITLVKKQRIILPPIHQDINLNQMLLRNNAKIRKIPVQWENNTFHITGQEMVCLKYLSQGQTIKSIAQLTQLSPRTVETYLQRIKQRLNVNSKNELLLLYKSNPLIME